MTNSKSYNTALDSFHQYLQGVLTLYQDTIPVLKEQLATIEIDNVEAINTSLNSQQALILYTKGFDSTVASYLSELGIPASNLSQMISQIPESERLRFSELLGQFGQALTEINFYKEKCSVLIQTKLYQINKTLDRQESQKDNITYNKSASEIHSQLFSKSFETTV